MGELVPGQHWRHQRQVGITTASTRTGNSAALHCQPVMRSVRAQKIMKSLWNAILKDALSTVWLRLIAGAIPMLIVSVFALPLTLQNLGVSLSLQTAQFLCTIAPLLVLSLGLIVLLVGIVYHYRFSRLISEQFTEYHGAFFKRQQGGGYHEAVYCGHCKKSTSIGTYHTAAHYKCTCGWVSDFSAGDFKFIFSKLPP